MLAELKQYSAPLQMPKDFLWAVATSSVQTERYYGEDRILSDWSDFLTRGQNPILSPDEKTADFFHSPYTEQFFEGIERLGVTGMRLSMSWPRIMPEVGVIDEKAVNRFREIADILIQKDISLVATAHHFEMPFWAMKKGGWTSPEVVQQFKLYTEILSEVFPDVPYWITINEPGVLADMGYLRGAWPPYKRGPVPFLQALKNLKQAHEYAYEAIKRRSPDAMVGTANHITWFEPQNPNSVFDKVLSGTARYILNNWLIRQTSDHCDFVGVNFYKGYDIGISRTPLSAADRLTTANGWPVVPDYFYQALLYIHQTFGQKPILVSEHGCAQHKSTAFKDNNDDLRAFYLLSHAIAAYQAHKAGVKILGLTAWSFEDNVELHDGTNYCFGLQGFNPENGERMLRRSGELFATIAGANEINVPELANKYLAPEYWALLEQLQFN